MAAEVFKKYIKEAENDITQFRTVWIYLNQKFNLSITPKAHTIQDHFVDYIKLTKQTLGETKD